MKQLLVFLSLMNVASANTLTIQAQDALVKFSAKGKPALISITGEGRKLAGTLTHENNNLSGIIQFELTSLETGIEIRDDHLKNNYLEVEKYPVASLKITQIDFSKAKNESVPFKGIMDLHGKQKEVTGEASIINNQIQAQLAVNLSDFAIDVPSYKGITVAKEVKINVAAQLLTEN